jgi:DamX protein
VVAGDYGVGKTRMAQALIDALDDADDICFVEGQITSDIDSLLAEVFAQFELSSQLEFAEFCKKNSEQDGLVVLIVDNAHHLTDEVIAALLNVLEENLASRLHLVLFAEPHLLDRLENVNAPDLVLTDFLLEKLSLHEAVDYLNFRMEMSDYLGPEVFAENKVESCWRQSQGQLLSLHEYAQEKLLASVRTVQASKPYKSNQLVPHIVVTSVLMSGLLLVLGHLYFGDDSPAKDVIPVVATPSAIVVAAQVSSQSPPINAAASSINVNAPLGGDKDVTPAPVKEIAAPVSSLRDANLDGAQIVGVVKQSVVPLAQTNALKDSLPKSAQTSSRQASKEAKKIAVTSESSGVVVQPKSKSAGLELAKQTSGFSDQEKAILGWGVSEFTLQLVGLSNEKAAQDFIAEQSNKKDLLLFRSLRQGKDWFVVVTGRFPSSVKARQAIQNLPAVQRQATPWPREIKVIQQEIKQHK